MNMSTKLILVGVTCAVAGVLLGVSLRAQGGASLFKGKDPKEAADALLTEGLKAAGKGSWERIAVGAVYYEGGDRSRGEAIFNAVLDGKPEYTDFQRIARLYAELGEWDKAKPLYEKAISMKGTKDDLLAEAGAYYNLHGERARAEELFSRAFDTGSRSPWAYSMAAASYLGKNPRPW
jgi:Tfp pilus assembly protein PilF